MRLIQSKDSYHDYPALLKGLGHLLRLIYHFFNALNGLPLHFERFTNILMLEVKL